MKKAFKLLAICLLSLFNSCNSVEPPSGQTIDLKLEDVSCTEVWITLSSNLKLPAAIELKQNSQVIKTINLDKTDSLLYVDSLLPNSSYSFLATNSANRVTSNQLQVATLDTTSHNYSWQTYTFGGQVGSCNLNDVAIIDKNNIWVVGEIYLPDSLGQPVTYNAVYWDGSEWGLKRIKTNACGGVDYPPIKAIFTFSEDDILFAHIDGSITHYNGIEFTNDCSLITQLNGSANKIWGISKNDYYVVSGNGFIGHYNGQSWQRIQSGTSLNINDIWGSVDNQGNKYILCAAYDFGTGGEKKLLSINGFLVNEISWVDNRELYTVWFNTKNKIYAGGEGLFVNVGNGWELQDNLQNYFTFRIRGEGSNNVFGTGGFGFTVHYNGLDWKVMDEAGLSGGNYESLDVKGNTVALVGFEGNAAVVSIGTRQ